MPLQIHEKIFVGKKEQLTLENVGKLKVDQIFVNTDEMFKAISEGQIGQKVLRFSKFEISNDSLMEGFDPEKRSLIICETCKTNSLIFVRDFSISLVSFCISFFNKNKNPVFCCEIIDKILWSNIKKVARYDQNNEVTNYFWIWPTYSLENLNKISENSKRDFFELLVYDYLLPLRFH